MGERIVTRGYCRLLSIASLLTYLLIVMGGVVCVTGSGLGCPDWPMCYGQIVPPLDMGAIIETTHRFFAAATTPLIVAAAVLGWRRYRSVRWLSRPAVIAVGLVLAVVVFGAFAVLTGLPPVVAAIDVGSALMVLALVLTTWRVALARRDNPELPDRLAFRTPFAKLTLSALAAVFLVLVGGVLVAEVGSVARCVGWPLYGVVAGAGEIGGSLPAARRVLGVVAAGLIVAVTIQAWRRHRDNAPPSPRGHGAGRRARRRSGGWNAHGSPRLYVGLRRPLRRCGLRHVGPACRPCRPGRHAAPRFRFRPTGQVKHRAGVRRHPAFRACLAFSRRQESTYAIAHLCPFSVDSRRRHAGYCRVFRGRRAGVHPQTRNANSHHSFRSTGNPAARTIVCDRERLHVTPQEEKSL